MKNSLEFVDAVPADARLLTETAFLSKKHWGYPDDLMDKWREDIRITAEYISANKVVKANSKNGFVGFFGLKRDEHGLFEIDHLWILPAEMRKGYGSEMFRHIMEFLQSQRQQTVTLVGDPNAIGFYEKMGGRVVGQNQSAGTGRVLDTFEFRTWP